MSHHSILNITNGDATVELFQAARLPGDFLPWRDILHMGPVPLTETLAQLSDVRAGYLAERGFASAEELQADFAARDEQLKNAVNYTKIRLWFEHDLYDQLQLIQLLDALAELPLNPGQLTLINPDKHLGHHTPDQVSALLHIEAPITPAQFALAQTSWRAFRQPVLHDWAALLSADTQPLPFLRAAILRSLQELPDADCGINLTEHFILTLVAAGKRSPGQLFRAYCAAETAEFHGDASFFWFVDGLTRGAMPLLTVGNNNYGLTANAAKVLDAEKRWQRPVDRPLWLGGCNLTESGICWDNQQQRLISA